MRRLDRLREEEDLAELEADVADGLIGGEGDETAGSER